MTAESVCNKGDFEKHYLRGQQLGRGRFGTVFSCTRLDESNFEYAAKFIRTVRQSDRQSILQEVEMLKLVNGHENILQLHDMFLKPNEIILVTELVSGGELFDRICDNDDNILLEDDCACFIRQLCCALDYVHSKNVVHLDVKPENVLCCSKETPCQIKLIDFGMAQLLDSKKPVRVLKGTAEFAAPEVAQYDPISDKTDCWSLGVVTYVLLSGVSPFHGESDAATLANITRAEYEFGEDFENVSEDAKDFVSQLLVKDTKTRYSASDALKHKWLCSSPSRDRHNSIMTKRHRNFRIRRKWLVATLVLQAANRFVGCATKPTSDIVIVTNLAEGSESNNRPPSIDTADELNSAVCPT